MEREPTPGAPLVVGSFDHVSFLVDHIDEAMAFYCGALGGVPVPRPDLGFPGAWLRLGGVVVHLLERPDDVDWGTPAPAPTGFADHVAFRVESYDVTLAALRARGLEVYEGEVGIRQLFVQDPSGNVIELLEAPG